MKLRMLCAACSAAIAFGVTSTVRADDAVYSYNQWKVTLSDGLFSIEAGERRVTGGMFYGFKPTAHSSTGNGIRYTGTAGGKNMTVEYGFSNGKLRFRAETQADDHASPGLLMIWFAGEDLAGGVVQMDDTQVKVPRVFVAPEFPHASRYVFFGSDPGKTLKITTTACAFSNLRDFRAGDQNDLKLYAMPNSSGVVAAEIDLTTAKQAASAPRSSDALLSFTAADDLHVPSRNLGRNLIPNPSFEGGLSEWTFGGLDSGERPTDGRGWSVVEGGRTGKRSALFVGCAKNAYPMLASPTVVVEPNLRYTASFWAKSDTPGASVSLFVQSGRWGDFPLAYGTRLALTSEWTRYKATFSVDNSFARLCFGPALFGTSSDCRIWVDDVQLEEGAAETEFDSRPLYAYSSTGTFQQCLSTDSRSKSVTVTLVNTSSEERAGSCDIQIQDWNRNKLLEERLDARLRPYESASKRIDLSSVSARGLLRVVMKASSGEYSETFYGRIAVYEPISSPGRVRYGLLVANTVSVADLQARQPFGVTGALSFTPLAEPGIVDRLNALGVESIMGIYGKGSPISSYGYSKEPVTPRQWRDFDSWLATYMAQYPAQRIWKTINEPNCAGATWPMSDFVTAVSLISKNAKRVNPNAVVLTPDPYNASRGGQGWLEQFLAAGGNRCVDAVAIHTYRGRPEQPDLDRDIRMLTEMKARYGLSKAPIYFTEGEGETLYTIPSLGMSPFSGFAEWRMGLLSNDVGRSELAAAALMQRTLLMCLKNSEQVKFYLSWTQDDASAGQPLATRCAANVVLSLLGNASFTRELLIGDNTKTYLFRTVDDRPVAAIWSYDLKIDKGESPAVDAAMPIPGPDFQVIDFMGNIIAPATDDGRWRFKVSGLPVFVVGPRGKAGQLEAALGKTIIGTGGLRTVALTTRLAGNGRIDVHFANQTLDTLDGTISVQVDGNKASSQRAVLAPKQEQVTSVVAARANSGFQTTMLHATFAENGGNTIQRDDTLRWFVIPKLHRSFVPDGSAENWDGVRPIDLSTKDAVLEWTKSAPWSGPAEFSASCRFGWSDDGLYARIDVVENVFSYLHSGDLLWQNSGVQLYLDLLGDARDAQALGYGDDDESFWVTCTPDFKSIIFRDYTPAYQIGFVQHGPVSAPCVVKHVGNITTYEFKLPAKEIFPIKLRAGTSFGCALLVNEADKDGNRIRSLTFTPPGTEPHNRPDLWPVAILAE